MNYSYLHHNSEIIHFLNTKLLFAAHYKTVKSATTVQYQSLLCSMFFGQCCVTKSDALTRWVTQGYNALEQFTIYNYTAQHSNYSLLTNAERVSSANKEAGQCPKNIVVVVPGISACESGYFASPQTVPTVVNFKSASDK